MALKNGAMALLVAAAALLVSSYAVAQTLDRFGQPTLPTLDIVEQVSLERHALRIAAMPSVQQELQATKAFFRAYRWGATRDGQNTLDAAAEMYGLFVSQFALINDPARPKIIWAEATPHEWHGVRWPGSKWGIDNPDNMYRYVALDGVSTYEIEGRRAGPGPAQQTFLIYSSLPGTAAQNKEGADVVGSLSDREISYAEDGSFTITVGPNAAGPNHIRTTADAKVMFIRDTLSDWTHQRPNHLRIRRIAGPPAPPPRSDLQIAEEAAKLLKLEVAYWTQYYEQVEYKPPANTIPRPFARPGGWGFLTTGWFNLRNDQAWVVTLDPVSARSLGFQVSDVWGVASEYVRHTSSLNMAQAKPNSDGTYTFVIAPKDPGVWNWIDPVGANAGMFTLRWQELSDRNRDANGAVRLSQVVPLAKLKTLLPKETVFVTAEQRAQQQRERAATFALRFED